MSFRGGVVLDLVSVWVAPGVVLDAGTDLPRVLCESWFESLRVLVEAEVGADADGGGTGRGRAGRAGGMWTATGLWTTEEMLSPMLETGEGLELEWETDVSAVEALVWEVSEACSEFARWMMAGPGRGASVAIVDACRRRC